MIELKEKDIVGECKRLEPKFELKVDVTDAGITVRAEAPSLSMRWAKAIAPGPNGTVDDELVQAAKIETLVSALHGLRSARSVS